MVHSFGKIPTIIAGFAAIALVTGAGPAGAAPLAAAKLANPSPLVEQAQVFKRGRPPVYPYYYAPRRGPNGWSFYFGPVPYQKGDFEVQALQRLYPQTNWPPSMRYWTPQSQF